MSELKKLLAYLKAFIVLIKAYFHGKTNNGFYEVSFTKINKKWYCDVPGFPKELFEHTLMVAGASRFLAQVSPTFVHIPCSTRVFAKMHFSFVSYKFLFS